MTDVCESTLPRFWLVRKTGVVATTTPIRITRIKSGPARSASRPTLQKVVAIDRDPPRINTLGHRRGAPSPIPTPRLLHHQTLPRRRSRDRRVHGGLLLKDRIFVKNRSGEFGFIMAQELTKIG